VVATSCPLQRRLFRGSVWQFAHKTLLVYTSKKHTQDIVYSDQLTSKLGSSTQQATCLYKLAAGKLKLKLTAGRFCSKNRRPIVFIAFPTIASLFAFSIHKKEPAKHLQASLFLPPDNSARALNAVLFQRFL
jgi:hypothetical protein